MSKVSYSRNTKISVGVNRHRTYANLNHQADALATWPGITHTHARTHTHTHTHTHTRTHTYHTQTRAHTHTLVLFNKHAGKTPHISEKLLTFSECKLLITDALTVLNRQDCIQLVCASNMQD